MVEEVKTVNLTGEDWLRFLALYSYKEKCECLPLVQAANFVPKIREWLQGFYAVRRKVNASRSESVGPSNYVCAANPSNLRKLLKKFRHAMPRFGFLRVVECGVAHNVVVFA